MDKAREIVREVLSEAECPAVLWSGGKDSQLLLSLVREVRDVPVIWFRPATNERFAKKIILEWNLEAWSWQPSDVYVLPNMDSLTLVREQAFGQHRFPVLLDIEDGQKCIADCFPERTPELFPHFDSLFIGYKDSDEHWTLGGSNFCPPDGWELGRSKVFAPLRHMNDTDVWKAIKELNVPVDEERYFKGGQDPDSVEACSKCLQAGEGEGEVWCNKESKYIPRLHWQPEERLDEFRQRFGFKRAA